MPLEHFSLESASALEPRTYVVLVCGTMNPPHAGHIQLGLHGARGLKEHGHKVSAVCWLPVHDNYLLNKVSVKQKKDPSASFASTMCFSMEQRCNMLRALIAAQKAPEADVCHVLDYEMAHGSDLLEDDAEYWKPQLPDGYFLTISSPKLIDHFAKNSPLMTNGAQIAVVFGSDNLAWMPSWAGQPNPVSCADLVIVGRASAQVPFCQDPSAFLGGIKHFELRGEVPVSFQEEVLFGNRAGSYTNIHAVGEHALFVLPEWEDNKELSSTCIRTSLAECIRVLSLHGYNGSELPPILRGVAAGPVVSCKMMKASFERNELVKPEMLI